MNTTPSSSTDVYDSDANSTERSGISIDYPSNSMLSIHFGSIQNVSRMHRGSRAMFLKNANRFEEIPEPSEDIKVMELMNIDVELPPYDDTLYWCRVFRVNDFTEKSHLIKVRRVLLTMSSLISKGNNERVKQPSAELDILLKIVFNLLVLICYIVILACSHLCMQPPSLY